MQNATNELRIGFIKTKNLGLKGMTVGFTQIEKGEDKLPWNVQHETKYPMPVGPAIRDCFDKIAAHMIKVLGYDNERIQTDHIDITRIDYTTDGSVRVSMNVLAITGRWSSVNSPWVKIADEFDEYQDLIAVCNTLWDLTAKYILGKQKVNPKQYVLDLFDKAESESKEFDLTKEEIGRLSKEEAYNYMIKCLEENGAIFLDHGNVNQPEAEAVN